MASNKRLAAGVVQKYEIDCLSRCPEWKSGIDKRFHAVGYITPGTAEVQARDRSLIKRLLRRHRINCRKICTDLNHDPRRQFGRPVLAKAIATALKLKLRLLVVASCQRFGTREKFGLLSAYLAQLGLYLIDAESIECLSSLAFREEEDYGQPEQSAVRDLRRLKQLVGLARNRTRPGRPRTESTADGRGAIRRIIALARKLPKGQWTWRSGKPNKRRSSQMIAAVLNQEGLRRPSGAVWTDDAVRYLLRENRPTWEY